MRTITIVSCLIVSGLFTSAHAINLNALIRLNVASGHAAYKELASPQSAAPQLWIHVRSPEEKRLVENNRDWLKQLRWQNQPIQIQPLEIVGTGPLTTELRIFKEGDRAPGNLLVTELAKGIPQIRLTDLSSNYAKLGLKPGHLELWLAPNLIQFGPSH